MLEVRAVQVGRLRELPAMPLRDNGSASTVVDGQHHQEGILAERGQVGLYRLGHDRLPVARIKFRLIKQAIAHERRAVDALVRALRTDLYGLAYRDKKVVNVIHCGEGSLLLPLLSLLVSSSATTLLGLNQVLDPLHMFRGLRLNG